MKPRAREITVADVQRHALSHDVARRNTTVQPADAADAAAMVDAARDFAAREKAEHERVQRVLALAARMKELATRMRTDEEGFVRRFDAMIDMLEAVRNEAFYARKALDELLGAPSEGS